MPLHQRGRRQLRQRLPPRDDARVFPCLGSAIDPAQQVAGVYAAQLSPSFDARAVRLVEEFEAAVYRLA